MARRSLVAAAALLALGVAACGSSSSSSGASGGAGSGSAALSGELKFGVLVSLSGPASGIGSKQKVGLEMAAAELNSKSGIAGKKVVIVAQDDGGTATTAVQGARKLIDQEQVAALFGPTLSAPTLAVVPIVTAAKDVEFGTSVVPALGDPSTSPYFFRVSPTSTFQAKTFVQYMQKAGLKHAAILAVNNALGTSNVTAFKAAIAGTDITISDTKVNDTGTVDLTPQLQQLKNASPSPDVLLLFNTANPDQIAALKARTALLWNVPVLGFSTLADPSVKKAVGDSGMANVFAGQSYARLTASGPQRTKDWVASLRTYLKESPLTSDVSQVAIGYDAMMMYANAVNTSGSTDAQTVRGYLEQHDYDGIANSYHYDTKRHDGITLDDLAFVQAGSFNDGAYSAAP